MLPCKVSFESKQNSHESEKSNFNFRTNAKILCQYLSLVFLSKRNLLLVQDIYWSLVFVSKRNLLLVKEIYLSLVLVKETYLSLGFVSKKLVEKTYC